MDTKPEKSRISASHGARSASRFTSSRIGSLGAGTYTDPACVGLQLRVTQKAAGLTRSWLLRFKFRGEESRILLGHFPALSLADARRAAMELRERAAQGIDPRRATARRVAIRATPAPSTVADPYTVAGLASTFMELHVRPHRKKPEYVEQILSRDVLPHWGERDARTIEPPEVVALLDGIVARGSPVQANRVAGVLGQLFRFGIHRRIVTSSPVQLLFRPGGKEKPRERVLSDDELRVIVSDPQGALRLHRTGHIVMALLLTGQRRGELTRAQWKEIDWKARTWRIPPENSKNGRGHLVPLSLAAVEQFEALHRLAEGSRYVIPAAEGDEPIDAKLVTRSLARCLPRLKKLGVGAFTLHDLRRTCRTGLARIGIRPDIAERVLNHTPERILATYDVHQYLDEKRDALERWAAHLEQLRPRQ